jgi:hypothetical protein
MTLPGFRSRCTTPARCARSSACAIWRPEREHLGHGQRALLQAARQRLAVDELHHQVVDAVLATDVVQRADVGMTQLRDGARLAVEAGAGLGRLGQVRRQHLHGHIAAQARVAGAVDLAHAAGAERGDDLVRTEHGAGSQHRVPCPSWRWKRKTGDCRRDGRGCSLT